MRALLLTVLVACTGSSVTPEPDGGTTDAVVIPPGGNYWACYFWPDIPNGTERCAPKCSNKTLLGRPTFGAGCQTIAGECPAANMTGPASMGGACCWETSGRVDLLACQGMQ